MNVFRSVPSIISTRRSSGMTSRFLPAARLSLGLLALGAASASGFAQSLDAHVAPAIMQLGKNLGLENPSTELSLTVWLNPHNRADLDARVEGLYTPGSSTFHKWLTDADLKTYMPTEAEIGAVHKELTAHNLKITSNDPMNMSVRFTGKVSDIESAFNTHISRYSVRGEVVHTTSTEPKLGGVAAGLMHSLGGVNSVSAKPLIVRPKNLKTGKVLSGIPLSAAGKPEGTIFSGQCFYAASTTKLSGVNALDDVTPVTESLYGVGYGANPANTANGTLPSCGYSPSEVQGFYGLKTAYGRGYNGAGQTIVIVDVGLNEQAKIDGNVFNKLEGLPLFTSSNYKAYNPEGVTITGADYGADEETDLDVEWAHASAPGAKIALVQTFGDNEDLQYGIYYAITQNLGNVISLSYGEPEAYVGPVGMSIFNQIAELGAAKGISLQVSTGDDGDFTDYGIPADVNGFASSPYDTAVGGTSIAVDPVTGKVSHLGWGNNAVIFTYGTGYIVDPPTAEDNSFFYAGSGGGVSSYFAKPAYQKKLSGPGRHLPDVSALADPFTGAEFVYDFGGTTYVGVVGGTSLASPLFSGMWAILNQYSGTPLGQAAPYVATTPHPLLTDVLPLSGPVSASAKVKDPSGTTTYSATELFQPLGNTTSFLSTIWEEDTFGDYAGVSFGTDSSLTVTQGWDNVTGYGTPNMGAIFSSLP
jgi:subtilase family serine protease